MAEQSDNSEKTEEPTQRRIDEFRNKGQVAASKELASVLLLSAAVLTLILSSTYMYETLDGFLEWLYKLNREEVFEHKTLLKVLTKSFITILSMIAPVLIVSLCISYISHVMQVGFIFTTEPLNWKFDKLNPISGLQRIFSKKAVFDLFKNIGKFLIAISIAYVVMLPFWKQLIGFLDAEIVTTMSFAKAIFIKLIFSILGGFFVLSLIDFSWEKYTYKQKLRMTKKELKEEMKQQDGNPEIKQKIRSIQRETAKKRMIQEVKTADVIVTNPTHLSIAIKYNGELMHAPRVVAKGGDHLAFKIREIANENKIPIVENVPLARALYATVELNDFVPRNLYKAVAEILAYVYKLRKKAKALG
jgi:flagellar biosynthetic protein FlhB